MKLGYFAAAMAVGLWFAQAGLAQDAKPAAAELQWFTSFDKAAAEAQKSSKPILADFTGSDWSPGCIKLRKEVFDTQEFKDWAAKNVVLLEVDFPTDKRQDGATRKANADLARKHNVEGYPTIIFMKSDGARLGESGYQEGGPKPWIASAQKILDAKKSAAK